MPRSFQMDLYAVPSLLLLLQLALLSSVCPMASNVMVVNGTVHLQKIAIGDPGTGTSCHRTESGELDCLYDEKYCTRQPFADNQCSMLESEVDQNCGKWDQCDGVICGYPGGYCLARTKMDDSRNYDHYRYRKGPIPAPTPPATIKYSVCNDDSCNIGCTTSTWMSGSCYTSPAPAPSPVPRGPFSERWTCNPSQVPGQPNHIMKYNFDGVGCKGKPYYIATIVAGKCRRPDPYVPLPEEWTCSNFNGSEAEASAGHVFMT